MSSVVLVIAGVDPSGGAGLVADAATVVAHGLHPAAVPTALTLQDSRSCRSIQPVDLGWLRAELALLREDLGARIGAVKVGMVGHAGMAQVIAAELGPLTQRGVPLVLDPVLRASVGAQLLEGDPRGALAPLLPEVALLTPNRGEAERLCGVPVDDEAGQRAAAAALRRQGARAVLVKGGHLEGDVVTDLLDDGAEPLPLRSPRLGGETPHGTGCALSTSIACQLALGQPLREAVRIARAAVARRIAAAERLGQGRPFLAPPV